MRIQRQRQGKASKVVFLIIEIMWLLMGGFTTYAGIVILNRNDNNSWFAWLYFVFALICIMMFFLRRNMRKKNQRKQSK